MNVTAVVDYTITLFGGLFTLRRKRIFHRQIARTDRRLAVAAGNINNIVWLT